MDTQHTYRWQLGSASTFSPDDWDPGCFDFEVASLELCWTADIDAATGRATGLTPVPGFVLRWP